jgi:hypothetical protein
MSISDLGLGRDLKVTRAESKAMKQLSRGQKRFFRKQLVWKMP